MNPKINMAQKGLLMDSHTIKIEEPERINFVKVAYKAEVERLMNCESNKNLFRALNINSQMCRAQRDSVSRLNK